ncbi:MAG: radical SAM protein [Bacteroidetes bacterium]|nr:radical SAM protein [Bacteroidota bacterium]
MLQDQLNFLGKMSVSKFANMGVTLASYYWSRWTGNPDHWGKPISLSIEPTTACNLRCPECLSGLRSFTRPTGKLSEELLAKVLRDVKAHCTYINFYFQGEPYLHPDFLGLIKQCKENGIYSATSTNAHFLDDQRAKQTVESGLDRLIISIDGTEQETYENYRKEGKLEKVLEGTKNILKWKKELNSRTPHVIFQVLAVRPNEHQIDEVKALGKQIGVDEVRIKTAQIYDFEDGNDLIPTIDKYSRYKQGNDGKWSIKNPLDDHCWRMWSGAVITWDGKLVPCCFDKDAQHTMGDLNSENFNSIWQSESYRAFRASILRSRSEIEMCKNCSEGTTVWN